MCSIRFVKKFAASSAAKQPWKTDIVRNEKPTDFLLYAHIWNINIFNLQDEWQGELLSLKRRSYSQPELHLRWPCTARNEEKKKAIDTCNYYPAWVIFFYQEETRHSSVSTNFSTFMPQQWDYWPYFRQEVALPEAENNISSLIDAFEVGNRGAGDEVSVEVRLRALKTPVGYCKGQCPLPRGWGGGGLFIDLAFLFFWTVPHCSSKALPVTHTHTLTRDEQGHAEREEKERWGWCDYSSRQRSRARHRCKRRSHNGTEN